MNVPAQMLFGEDSVSAQLLLDTGAQRSFVSQNLYNDKLVGRTNKYRSFVRMYGVGEQELATSGEVELDIQIGDDIVRQKFIIADIKEEGILGFDFCKNHQAEWRWKDNQLKLGGELEEDDSSSIPGQVARITLKQLTVIPSKSEIVTIGILEHAKDCEEMGLIQPQSHFLETHQIGVAAVLARKEENSVPMRLINNTRSNSNPSQEHSGSYVCTGGNSTRGTSMSQLHRTEKLGSYRVIQSRCAKTQFGRKRSVLQFGKTVRRLFHDWKKTTWTN